MRGMASALGLCAFAAAAVAWGEPLRNPPVRDCDPGKDAECACDSGNTTLTNGCVQISLDLGRTSVLSDGRRVALKILEMEVSPSIFTPAALNVVWGTPSSTWEATEPSATSPKRWSLRTPTGRR